MTIIDLLKWLDENGVWHHVDSIGTNDGWVDLVYIYGRNPYDNKDNKYIPYIRVSKHDEPENIFYVRENGYCCYMTTKEVLDKSLRLRDGVVYRTPEEESEDY